MPTTLLVVGAGLFGSQAAAYARLQGLDAMVFDPGLPGAASPAAAGLFKEAWAGHKLRQHFHGAVTLLDQLYGIRQVDLDALTVKWSRFYASLPLPFWSRILFVRLSRPLAMAGWRPAAHATKVRSTLPPESGVPNSSMVCMSTAGRALP